MYIMQCPEDKNSDQSDIDQDGVGDVCDNVKLYIYLCNNIKIYIDMYNI